MKTSKPIVEVMPASAQTPEATAMDQTAVDPWQGIDDPVPVEVTAVPASRKLKAAPNRERSRNPQTRTLPSSWRVSRSVWGIVAVSLLLLVGGGFAAYKLVFETKDGTLHVEVDGDADVRFNKGELKIFDADGKLKYTLTPSEKNKTVPPGNISSRSSGAAVFKVESRNSSWRKRAHRACTCSRRRKKKRRRRSLVAQREAAVGRSGHEGEARVCLCLAVGKSAGLRVPLVADRYLAGRQTLFCMRRHGAERPHPRVRDGHRQASPGSHARPRRSLVDLCQVPAR